MHSFRKLTKVAGLLGAAAKGIANNPVASGMGALMVGTMAPEVPKKIKSTMAANRATADSYKPSGTP